MSKMARVDLIEQHSSASFRFIVLITIVIAAGASQGLLLPLLTILLEQAHISSGMNGLNAAALYMGIFLSLLFIERPVIRFGYKPVIMGGIVLAAVAALGFPLWNHLVFWFILRIIVGIGDSALHYAAQLWITSTSPKNKRGRNISLYGMAYGIGFSIGPIGINLVRIHTWVPFAAIAVLFLLVLLLLLRLPNGYPPQSSSNDGKKSHYTLIIRMAWFALLPSFLYGYLEASMNSNFPVYGLRIGLSTSEISLMLPMIGIGTLLLQLPLGMWSDRIGRKKILLSAGIVGGAALLLVPLAGANTWLILLLFLLAGGMVGSFFTLGLAYTADLIPAALLPAANIIASVNFSTGSIMGPYLGGMGIQYVSPSSMFWLLGGVFLLFALSGFKFKPHSRIEE